MEKKLKLGCGYNPKEGWINLDKFHQKGVNIVHDLEKLPWPFKNGEFGYIEADNTLEHLTNLDKIFSELNRVLKKGGVLNITVPHYSSFSAYCCFHKTFFRAKDFVNCSNKRSMDINVLSNFEPIEVRIRFFKKLRFFPLSLLQKLLNINRRFLVFLEASKLIYLLPVSDMNLVLKKK